VAALVDLVATGGVEDVARRVEGVGGAVGGEAAVRSLEGAVAGRAVDEGGG